MLQRVVLDTSVLVSGVINASGPSAHLVNALRSGRLELLVCPTLITELQATLLKPRLQRWLPDPAQSADYVTAVSRWSTHYPDPAVVDSTACRDPNDAYLLALGIATDADAIISGDKDLTILRRHRPPVLTPRQAVDRIADDRGRPTAR